MKKTISLLLALVMLLTLSACKGGDKPGPLGSPEPTQQAENTGISDATAEPETTLSPGVLQYTGDLSYNPETDFDPRLGNALDTFIDVGDFYIWHLSGDYYIRYADKSGGDWGVLCGKPECEHEYGGGPDNEPNKTCNAYIGSVQGSLWIDGDKLYYVNDWERVEGESLGGLHRLNLDGTGHEKVCMLPELLCSAGEALAPQRFYFHRGMIYCRASLFDVVDGEPVARSGYYALKPDGSECTTIFESSTGRGGYMAFMGEYCYVIDVSGSYDDDGNAYTENTLLRWSPNTQKAEVLYRGGDFICPNPGEWFLSGGNIYLGEPRLRHEGSRGVMYLEDGGWEELINFEDPEIHYTTCCVSDGIAIAENYTEMDSESEDYVRGAWKSLDKDIWIKDFEGNTIYKGKLPMDWMGTCEEAAEMKEISWFYAFGNMDEIWVQFVLDNGNDHFMRHGNFLVKYVPVDGGLEATLTGAALDMLEEY